MDPSDLTTRFPSTVLLLKSLSPNELEPEAPKSNAALTLPHQPTSLSTIFPTFIFSEHLPQLKITFTPKLTAHLLLEN